VGPATERYRRRVAPVIPDPLFDPALLAHVAEVRAT